MTDNVSITPDIVHFFNSSFVLEDQLGIGSILKGDVSWWLIHECSLSGLCERATKLQPLRVPNPPLHLAPHVWRYRSSCPHRLSIKVHLRSSQEDTSWRRLEGLGPKGESQWSPQSKHLTSFNDMTGRKHLWELMRHNGKSDSECAALVDR